MTNDHVSPCLVRWIAISSGMALRDLWLATHGGGATPGWLLRWETAAFSASAIAGLARLASPPGAADRCAAAFRPVTVTLGVAAVAIHGVRLGIYLKARA